MGIESREASAHALRWAVRLAAWLRTDAVIDAVHVVKPAPSAGFGLPPHSPQSMDQERRSQAEAELDRLIRDVSGGVSVTVERSVLFGEPAETLLDVVDGHDLLVLGATELGPLSGLVLGSVSQKCLSAGTVPVAIIPPVSPLRSGS